MTRDFKIDSAKRRENEAKLRKGVFGFCTSRFWEAIVAGLSHAFPESEWDDCWEFDYYKASRLHADDKFGLLLWEALSFDEFDFTAEVPDDEALSYEMTSPTSPLIHQVSDISRIWLYALERCEVSKVALIGHEPKKRTQREYRAWYRHVGELLGIDSMVSAYAAGTPLDYILI